MHPELGYELPVVKPSLVLPGISLCSINTFPVGMISLAVWHGRAVSIPISGWQEFTCGVYLISVLPVDICCGKDFLPTAM